ncbi:hypothetical protein [Rummeliibacillus suwonensis]|uniref:hypothetical protein n=1 Tax=Rummeliibacillus suwonensis TaxID=1306154 RepID=UPI00289ECAD9|nr:hypothetical protein [Rummeliibacillus suwonensis]
MRIKPFISMGLASILIVPTLITAANPELAHAKTSSKASSKKISAKAKSVIYKIKAINPKKTNYISKTKAAVSAYNKLSKKDKKMVYNYSTLKKHWSKTKAYLKKIDNLNKKVAALNTKNYATKIAAIKKQYSSLNRVTKAAVPKTTVKKINYYANRKANLVIASIKAINPKKSDYIVKTKAAVSAYKKLSKTDKKKVTNYATLKKYWKNIQPYLKKIDTLNKNVSTLNSKNFPTKSVSLQKQFDSLNAATQAAVPSTTLKKLSYYSDVVSTNKLVLMSTGTTTPDGTKILAIINAYKKLSGAQQSLLKDLISDKEEAKANLARYLALEAIIKKAADIEKQYAALKSASKTYAQDLVALYKNYNTVKGDSIDYNETTYSVSNFVPDDGKITNMGAAYANEINKAQEFNDKIDQLEAGTLANPYETIKTDLPTYKVPSITVVASNYPKVAPIDLADKNAVATYKKYESVPDIIDGFKNVSLDPLNQLTWAGSGEETSKILLSSTKISKLADLLPQYNKLGANQKAIVQNKLAADSNNAKDYLSEGKNLTSAQAIDKSYESALKNKAKSSYFADLKKVYDTYNAATPEVKRFVVNASNINDITKNGSEYSKALADANALKQAIEGLNENSTLSGINAVIGKYKSLSNQMPTPLSLVDSATLKTYNQFAAIPDVVKLVNKIPTKAEPAKEGDAYGYKSKDISNILSAIKSYKKLGSTQQTIVDNETMVDSTNRNPTIATLAADQSNITVAQKIDSAYAKLKKSSSTYTKDAKKVYGDYDDASSDVKKYIVNGGGISGLLTAIKGSQDIADTFETKVNALSKKSKIADVESAVDYYNTYITTSPKVSSLVDKAVLKKYNDYAPVSNVVKLLSLIKESNVSSPSVTPTDVKYIQQSTIAYNALKTDPKMIIDDADRSKFPFLYDGKYITEAAAIDKAYEKVKPTDDQYEIEILDVYYQMYDRAPAVVQKYVANKAELDKIGTRYATQLTIVRDFETEVRQRSHVSENGATPKIASVQSLEKYYFDNIKYNKINAKYNIPLSTLIDPEVMEEYRKYSLVLQIQDIAKTIYVLYGKLFNEENVEFDKVKDDFYCNDATGSLKDTTRCHPADYYDSSKKGYTDSGKRDGNPIKITNPNDIKLIYKAIDYFKQLDTPQIAILKKAPSSLNDTYYKDRYGGNNDPNTESGDVHPSIPMSMGEINNFLKAQEIDKEYEALSPSSKTYIQDAIALYYKFYKAGRPVQLYVIHENDIRAFENSYKMKSIIDGIDNFVKAVNGLANDKKVEDVINTVDLYNKLNEPQLSVIDQGVLTKYNAYAPIAEIKDLTGNIIKDSNGKYTESSINNMLKAIAIYKKLSKDPKAIVTNKINGSDSNAISYKYLLHESEIKAAQKVDKAFKALDKTDDKYVTKLKKVAKDFEALENLKLSGLGSSDTAKNYVTSNINEALQLAIYSKPNDQAEQFEKLIVGDKNDENDENALINKYPLTYADVEKVVKTDTFSYNNLSSKAKSLVDSGVMKIYNKYAPIVDVVTTLKGITPPTDKLTIWSENIKKPDRDNFDSNTTGTGYYQKTYLKRDIGTEISNAIQLYNKLGADQKNIVLNKVSPANVGDPTPSNGLTNEQIALLNETNNIKAAQALDKKIAAIKPKSSGYAKAVIDANKTLDVMPPEQRVYVQNATVLKTYGATPQMKKAIQDLSNFEQGVGKIDEWTSQLKNDDGTIANTCKESTTDSSGMYCNTAINNKMDYLKGLYEQLNTPRLIDGAETNLAPLIDRAVLARYQYFRAIYDVIDQL